LTIKEPCISPYKRPAKTVAVRSLPTPRQRLLRWATLEEEEEEEETPRPPDACLPAERLEFLFLSFGIYSHPEGLGLRIPPQDRILGYPLT